MAKAGKYDGLLLGAAFGLVLTTPKIADWGLGLLEKVIPSNWYIFGDISLTIIGVAAGALIGLIVEKTGKR